MGSEEQIPSAVQESVANFHGALSELEEIVEKSYLNVADESIMQEMTPLERAKVDLMALYTANSLYWMYLCTKGEIPAEHPIKGELERIRKHMDRVKEITDRQNAPRLNPQAAKNFVRSALWKPGDKPSDQGDGSLDTNGAADDSTIHDTAVDVQQQSFSEEQQQKTHKKHQLRQKELVCRSQQAHQTVRLNTRIVFPDEDVDEDKVQEVPICHNVGRAVVEEDAPRKKKARRQRAKADPTSVIE